MVLVGCVCAPETVMVRTGTLRAIQVMERSPLPVGGSAVGEGTGVRFRGGGTPPNKPISLTPTPRFHTLGVHRRAAAQERVYIPWSRFARSESSARARWGTASPR